MIHLGDVTKIDGAAVPIVDVIIGGSPCQDLSVAGKRAGLDGARSGLFMEQIRIIKEMHRRCKDDGANEVRPRYFVWENVPGSLSSNCGDDFRTVLEKICRIVDEGADVPRPTGGGALWRTSGCIMGDGYSVAWRVLDAQFWGVPQRRRRIALVADFRGSSAPEILFKRESLSGRPASCGPSREGTAADPAGCTGKAIGFNYTNSITAKTRPTIEKTEPLRAHSGGAAVCYSIDRAAFNQGINAQYDPTITDDGIAQTIVARGPSAVCVGVDGFNGSLTGGVASTLGQSTRMSSGRSHVLTAPPPTFCLQGNGIDRADTAGCNGKCVTEGVCYTLNTIDRPAVSDSSENYVVRRLTPLECERLQGFPDNWTRIGEAVGEEKYINDEGKEFVSLIYEYTGKDGKKHRSTDTERYKALGNSIAIPPWKWVLKRLCAEYERDATMASLFDGIGGFPLIWEQLNGRGSCLWASEIEPFPIAVTTAHFNQ